MDESNIVESQHTEWFAFRVRPRHEKSVALLLRERGCRPFLPLIREKRLWANRRRQVEMPLFPGYIFCRAVRNGLLPVLSTPGVVDVIRAGNFPLAANASEIEALQLAVHAQVPMERCHYIDLGTTVQVIDGPLAGLKGILVQVRKSQRLVLSVGMLSRSVLIEIDPHWVSPQAKAIPLSEPASSELGVSC